MLVLYVFPSLFSGGKAVCQVPKVMGSICGESGVHRFISRAGKLGALGIAFFSLFSVKQSSLS